MKETVVVGMSGGVDSSVAALLLKEQGYNVIGIFMHNWEEKDEAGHCTADQDYEDAKKVCFKLGIPFYSKNFAKEYMNRVFTYFLDEYRKGRTPNPDVLCNREVKFGPFLSYAMSFGADKIATGHYAGVKEKDGKFYLTKSFDQNKDQTYFLNQLNQEQLSKTMFPLTNIDKTKVREIALKYDLNTAKKKDSTGICFIGERKFREFLSKYLPNQKGKIVTPDGQVIGEHIGLMYYTIGQRKGLDIGGKKGFDPNKWFVVRKDLTKNELIVTNGEDDNLYSKGLVSYKVNWIPEEPKEKEFDCFIKVRYRQPDQEAHVKIEDGRIIVTFKKKQRAVTEGQYVVFYDKDNCLGGGVIEEVIF